MYVGRNDKGPRIEYYWLRNQAPKIIFLRQNDSLESLEHNSEHSPLGEGEISM